jgi:predicted cytidylate kinase
MADKVACSAERKMRITIAGDIGSGKTTIARELAKRVAVEMRSTGGIQRQLAATRGITTLELNRLAETDAAIDRQIDHYLKTLPDGNLVVESRMAWRFVPNTRKIFLYVLKHEAANRILLANRSDESYRLLDDAVSQISERRKSEVKRFKTYYDVNIDNLRNYDRVIDTTFASPDSVVERIMRPDAFQSRPGIWLNPKNLVPTCPAKHLNEQTVEELARSMAKTGSDESRPIEVVYVEHAFFVADGHARAAAAIRIGAEFVPLTLVACEDEPYVSGSSARSFVENAVTDDVISAWEQVLKFRFPHPIWKVPHHA